MPVEQWALMVLLSATVVCAAAQDAEEAAMPELEFIEYLGTMMRADDGWIDPLDFGRAEDPDSEVTAVGVDEPVSDLELRP